MRWIAFLIFGDVLRTPNLVLAQAASSPYFLSLCVSLVFLLPFSYIQLN